MSPSVHILSQTLINKIAAGEVIVRPASVVKELVENSFDAGARRIRVEISKDGRSITVSDDGCGMDEANAKRAILRNSTSKIQDFKDLEHLATRGFRGEALASIISISRFEMLTRQADDVAGARIVAEAGKVLKVEPVGVAPGTTLHVRDLFFNTPARLKFLKSPAAEFNILLQILTQQALSHPKVGLTCVREGATRFDLPPDQEPRNRIEDLLGSSVQGKLIPVDYERDGFAVRGHVARPEANRKDRRWQYLMVNGRPISARPLSFPIQEAYHGLLMKGRFPIIVLDMQMDPAEVDVNVHPTKEEVRFENERKVSGLLHRAINQALLEQNLMPTLEMPAAPIAPPPTFAERPASPSVAPQISPAASAADPSLPFVFSSKGVTPFSPQGASGQKQIFPTREFAPAAKPLEEPAVEVSDAVARCEGAPSTPPSLEPPVSDQMRLGDGPPPTPLGQIGRTYIVAEWGDDLLLIDQHAAHERLLYQRLLERPEGPSARQPLLLPIPIEVSPLDIDSLEALLPALAEVGVDIEKDSGGGDGVYCVMSLPSDFDSVDAEALVRDALDDARGDGNASDGVADLRDRVLIRLACHGAIKAGRRLHADEMAALIRDMSEARLSFTCPHGRPTMTILRKGQLDRQFGRIV